MSRQFVFFGRSSSLLLLIFYNFLLAITEMLAGSLCLLVTFFAKHLNLAHAIIQEADTSYLDQFVVWLLKHLLSSRLDDQLFLNIGLILIGLGIFKIFVAIGLWFKSHKMRMVALIIFGLVSIYGIYQIITDFSVLTVFSLVLDLYILYYFWRVLPRHLEG